MKNLSIQWKIAFLTSVYILIILVGSILFAVANFEKNLLKEREKNTVKSIVNIIESYKDFFIVRNLEKIDEMVKTISSLESIDEVVVLDIDGRIIGHSDIGNLGKFSRELLDKFGQKKEAFLEKNKNLIKYFYPVTVETTPIGYVVTSYDREILKASVDFDILKIAIQTLSISFFVIFASFIGTFVISGIMIRPIKVLKDKIVNLASNIDKPLKVEKVFKPKLSKECTKGISEECWLSSENASKIMQELGELTLRECQNCPKYKNSVSGEIEELTYSFYMMTASLQDYLKKLEEAYKERETLNCLASMGEMSAKIAHEIKNALYAIGNAADYMRRNVNNPLVKEFSTVIRNEVNRLNEITVSFLNFSKLIEPKFEYHNLNSVIEESIKLLEDDFKNENIQLQLELDTNIPKIKFDKNLFKQIILNLAINALDTLREKKEPPKVFKIQTKLIEKQNSKIIRITFEDSGTGIPEEIKDKIFKPFFSTKTKGTGLGLPIVYKIVYSHGWSINLDSNNKGTRFIIEIKLNSN
ncbi:MAG: two-component sensor histidine kinase [Aquificae bacterium]|nr:two-component sensor histidine kinase [Aquificota bacterium]